MHYTDEDTIALIVKNPGNMAKCISILRKYNNASIAEIKTAINSGHYVFGCEYTSTPGIRKVRRCYDELVKSGATVEIYEDGELTSRNYISNLTESYQEIEQETQDMIDAEVEADSEEN
jgi:hypothetical protein